MAKLPEYFINDSFLARKEQETKNTIKVEMVITRDEFVA